MANGTLDVTRAEYDGHDFRIARNENDIKLQEAEIVVLRECAKENRTKINFFSWFVGILLLVILALQGLNFGLLVQHMGK